MTAAFSFDTGLATSFAAGLTAAFAIGFKTFGVIFFSGFAAAFAAGLATDFADAEDIFTVFATFDGAAFAVDLTAGLAAAFFFGAVFLAMK
ncbi:MAG: hypothetical protein H7061_04395 [Bdellovibrionaceae bacterium]|nr:hypothetical protein [Bdellovibrio sp.]